MAFRSKRKKVIRYRGSKTHGGGAMKKRRGAGNRGGRGMAGTGKRGDAKKPCIWNNKRYFGKYGFTPQNKTTIKACSLFYLENKLPYLIEKKLIKEEKGTYVVDLAALGFNKLLSNGKVTKKYNITTDHASASAIEKVKAAGGNVDVKVTVKQGVAPAEKTGEAEVKESEETGEAEAEAEPEVKEEAKPKAEPVPEEAKKEKPSAE